jgi:hypothetical protein
MVGGFGSLDGQDAAQDRDASRDLVQLCCFVIAVHLAEVTAAEDDRVETTEARIQVAGFDRSVLAASSERAVRHIDDRSCR